MGAGVETPTKVKYIFGNIHPENVVFTDLETGPDGAKQAFRLEPGEVADFEGFFEESDLRKSRSLKIAIQSGWIKPCKTTAEVIDVTVHRLSDGRAPINDFDRRLAEELKKENEELERMKAGRDGLASRVMDLDK